MFTYEARDPKKPPMGLTPTQQADWASWWEDMGYLIDLKDPRDVKAGRQSALDFAMRRDPRQISVYSRAERGAVSRALKRAKLKGVYRSVRAGGTTLPFYEVMANEEELERFWDVLAAEKKRMGLAEEAKKLNQKHAEDIRKL